MERETFEVVALRLSEVCLLFACIVARQEVDAENDGRLVSKLLGCSTI